MHVAVNNRTLTVTSTVELNASFLQIRSPLKWIDWVERCGGDRRAQTRCPRRTIMASIIPGQVALLHATERMLVATCANLP